MGSGKVVGLRCLLSGFSFRHRRVKVRWRLLPGTGCYGPTRSTTPEHSHKDGSLSQPSKEAIVTILDDRVDVTCPFMVPLL